MTVSHTLLAFHGLGSFEKCWVGVSQTVPRLGFVGCFSHDWTGVTGLGGRAQRGGAPLPSRQGHCHPRGPPLRLTLTPRPRSCWPGFSPSGSSHPPTLCSLGGSRRAQPTPDTGRGAPPGGWRVRVNYWGFFCREFVSSLVWVFLS